MLGTCSGTKDDRPSCIFSCALEQAIDCDFKHSIAADLEADGGASKRWFMSYHTPARQRQGTLNGGRLICYIAHCSCIGHTGYYATPECDAAAKAGGGGLSWAWQVWEPPLANALTTLPGCAISHFRCDGNQVLCITGTQLLSTKWMTWTTSVFCRAAGVHSSNSSNSTVCTMITSATHCTGTKLL